jgi:hypothetical protein
MKGEELKLEDVETPHTLGGISGTLKSINLADLEVTDLCHQAKQTREPSCCQQHQTNLIY